MACSRWSGKGHGTNGHWFFVEVQLYWVAGTDTEMTPSACFVAVASLFQRLYLTQQASHTTEYPHSMANSIFLSKLGNKVQFTAKLALTRLLLWQIFMNFQIFQDTFRSNKPLRCWGSPINACTDTLILGACRHIKRAVCSSCPRRMSNSLSSILLDVSAPVLRVGACIAVGVRSLPQKFGYLFGRASRLSCWRS